MTDVEDGIPRVVRKSIAVVLVGILAFTSMLVVVPSASAEATWTAPTIVCSGQFWSNPTLAEGINGLYLLTWVYPWGQVMLYRSTDGGVTWLSGVNVLGGIDVGDRKNPSMCVYSEGNHDVILVVSGTNYVMKSVDDGNSFQQLTRLPMPLDVHWWGAPTIFTNASWFGGPGDSDIYVLGSMYVGAPWTGEHVLSLTKSHDGGHSWNAPVKLCPDWETTLWTKLISDGQTLYAFYSKLLPNDQSYEGIFLKTSSDWGTTWSNEELVDGFNSFMRNLQYIDHNTAFYFTIDVVAGATASIAGYGYFDFQTHQLVEAGRVQEISYGLGLEGASMYLSRTNALMVAWINQFEPSATIRYMSSSDAGVRNRAPLMTMASLRQAIAGIPFELTATCTPADDGTSSWSLETNAPWLSIESQTAQDCVISGTPVVGKYWARLSVSDGDTEDSGLLRIDVKDNQLPPVIVTSSGNPQQDRVKWTFSPVLNCSASLTIENHGLRSVTIDIIDIYSGYPKPISKDRVMFQRMGAFPSGTVTVNLPDLFVGHLYLISAVPYAKVPGDYCVITTIVTSA